MLIRLHMRVFVSKALMDKAAFLARSVSAA